MTYKEQNTENLKSFVKTLKKKDFDSNIIKYIQSAGTVLIGNSHKKELRDKILHQTHYEGKLHLYLDQKTIGKDELTIRIEGYYFGISKKKQTADRRQVEDEIKRALKKAQLKDKKLEWV